MNTTSSSLVAWESGKLARRRWAPAFDLDRERVLSIALLLLAGVVFAVYVSVLEQDVRRGDALHEAQRSHATATHGCEATTSLEERDACVARINSDGGANTTTADASL